MLHVSLQGWQTKVAVYPRESSSDGPALLPSFGEYPIYDQALYSLMSSDSLRNSEFASALSKVVAGTRVLDIGTGAHLNWVREALRLGAQSAVAVESIRDSFAAARTVVSELGLADQVDILHGHSMQICLSKLAEVCVAEIVGSVAGAEGAAAVISDAKRRLLAPGSVIVPHRAATRVAAASLRDVLGEHPLAFSEPAVRYLRKIFEWNGAPFDVRLRVEHPYWNTLLSRSAEAEVLDFNGHLHLEQVRELQLPIERRGEIDGLLAWLQLWASEDTEPIDSLRCKTNWASVYFPAFDHPVGCLPGDLLNITFKATLAADKVHPCYSIDAALVRGGRAVAIGQHQSDYGGRRFRRGSIYRTLFPE